MNGTCRSLERGELNDKERLQGVFRIRNGTSSMGMISAARTSWWGSPQGAERRGQRLKVISVQVMRSASQGWRVCTEVLPDISQAPV